MVSGDSVEVTTKLAQERNCDTIARNRSYGVGSQTRDQEIVTRANVNNINIQISSDYLLVEPEEVIPMKVFTPFKNRWLKELEKKDYTKPYTIDKICTPPLTREDTGGIKIYR